MTVTTITSTSLPAILANSADHPVASTSPVVHVEVRGVSDYTGPQNVYVATDRSEVWVAQTNVDGTVLRNVRIDRYVVEVIDVTDAMTPVFRADAVLAYRAAYDAIFSALQASGPRARHAWYDAHRTCAEVNDGVRRS